MPRHLNPEREGHNLALIKAALSLQVDHVKRPENWRLVEAARVVYSAGFFITVSPESILLVGKHCAEHSKIYCMNLSAPFISEARAAAMSPAAALSRGPGQAAAAPFASSAHAQGADTAEWGFPSSAQSGPEL